MSTPTDDEAVLHRLGYAQVLYREMGGFANFSISFTIISILAGCLTSYYIAFNYGGPVAITWGWLLVGAFCVLVALAMGEIASAMPTAGALYFWASKLGGPAWGWFTGWFNLIGQIAVTAAIDYGGGDLHDRAAQPVVPRRDRHRRRRDLHRLHGDHRAAPGDQPAGRQPARAAEHHLVVVAHGRRADHRRRAHRGARPPPVGRVRVRPDHRQLRVRRRPVLAGLRARPADGAVHDHRLRRVRAHERGDPPGLPLGGLGHGHVGRGLGGLRLHPAGGRDVRGAGRAGHARRRRERRRLHLDHVARRRLGRVPAAHRGGGAVLLRHGVGHVGVADDVRVLAGRRRTRLAHLAEGLGQAGAGQRGHRDRRPGLGADAAHPAQRRDRLPRRHVDRRHRPLHRVRDPDLPPHPGRVALRARCVEPRQPLQVDLAARRDLDRPHLHPVPAPGVAQGDPRTGLRLDRGQLRAADGRSAR